MRIITPARVNAGRTPDHNLGAYNLGGHPAGFPQGGGRFPRHNVGRSPRAGGFRGHNVGANLPQQGGDMARQIAAIMEGYGVGYDQCRATPPPRIPQNEEGCPEGWNQCK